MYLLDTNALGGLLRNRPRIVARAAQHVGQVITSVIVCGEAYYGVVRLPPGKRRDDLKARLDYLLLGMPCKPITKAVADIYADIRTATEQQGLSLDDNDLWIAATALQHGDVVVTNDSDFSRVPGLQVEDWT